MLEMTAAIFSLLRTGFAALLVVVAMADVAPAGQRLQAVADRPAAPNFTLTDLDDDAVALAGFKGKVVIVNFWATWCPPCRTEMPSMQRAWPILQKNDVMMLAVHVGGNADKIWAFIAEYEIDFPVLVDAASEVADRWPMVGLPTTFVVDTEGHIAYRAIGGREWDDPELLELVFALKR